MGTLIIHDMKRALLTFVLLTSLTSLPALEPIAGFAPGSRILFQGDSITDGNRGRNADPNHILGHGYVFIIAARHGAGFPEAKLEFINRGISGHCVTNLEIGVKAPPSVPQPPFLAPSPIRTLVLAKRRRRSEKISCLACSS